MAAEKEHVLLRQPDKLVVLAEAPASGSRDPQPTATLRLLVELCSDHGAGPADVDTMEDVACRVPLADLARQGAAERAFKDLVARIDNPALRPEVAAQTAAAAKQVRARCGAGLDELRGVEFRLRVVFIDDACEAEEEDEEDDDESGSDMEFGEFDLSGARSLRGQQTDAGYGYDYDYEEDDEDEDGCGAQFTVRPYGGALARGGGAPSSSSLLLSGFAARSDGPELTEEHELTSYDMQRVVRKALGGGGGSVEDDEAYLRALDGAAPVSPASRAAMVGQALRSARQQQQQQQQRSKSPRPIFPMRTGF